MLDAQRLRRLLRVVRLFVRSDRGGGAAAAGNASRRSRHRGDLIGRNQATRQPTGRWQTKRAPHTSPLPPRVAPWRFTP